MRLSVILPACNAELFLERAFDSVASLGDTQIIVVPHDSTDDTALVADELTSRTEGTTTAQTVEQAFARCSGRFVLCLEAHAALVHPAPRVLLERFDETTADAIVFQTRIEGAVLPEPSSTFVRRHWDRALAVVAATGPVQLANALRGAARIDWHDEVVSARTTVSPRTPRPAPSDVAASCAASIKGLLAGSGVVDVRRALLAAEFARLLAALPHLTPRAQAALAGSLEPALASAGSLLPERLQGRARRAQLLVESQLHWARREGRNLLDTGAARVASTGAGRALRWLVRFQGR